MGGKDNDRYICAMARTMAIDYGTKRVGIAVTDPAQIIATGLTTVHAKDLIAFIQNYMENEEVECIVVGEPKRLDGSNTEVSEAIGNLVRHLERKFPQIKIERQDERFTSKMASEAIAQSGLKKKDRQNKELVDEISATLILQGYMDRKKGSFN